MSADYTLPPVPDHPESCIADHWSPCELSAISDYGYACADWPTDCYHRTPLLTGSGPWVNPLAAEVEKLRANIDRAEISYGNMAYADDKRPAGTTEYTRGWGDCLRVITRKGEGSES